MLNANLHKVFSQYFSLFAKANDSLRGLVIVVVGEVVFLQIVEGCNCHVEDPVVVSVLAITMLGDEHFESWVASDKPRYGIMFCRKVVVRSHR